MKKLLLMCTLVVSSANLFGITFQSSEIIRQESLNAQKMQSDPMEQFQDWYRESAKKTSEREAACFILATVNDRCEPSTRTMIARTIDRNGISFIGDLSSTKFQQLRDNPSCAATFLWYSNQRQINLIGKAQPLTYDEAKLIWDKQDKATQASFLVAQQDQEIQNFDQLSQKHQQLMSQHQNAPIPMPQNWGGYRLAPVQVEYWQAGKNNDFRVVYTKDSNGRWVKKLLTP